jgi:hypothetical protein
MYRSQENSKIENPKEKQKNQRKTNCHRLHNTDMQTAPSSQQNNSYMGF